MPSISRSKIVGLSIVIAISLPFLLTNSANADPPLGGEYGGNISVAILSPIDLNPSAAGSQNKIVHELVYDSLARKDPETFSPIPWLASSWTIDEGLSQITFDIRPDAKWSDGSNLTVDDVKWNYQRAGYTVTQTASSITVTLSSGGGRFLDEGIYLPISSKDQMTTYDYSGPFHVNDTSAQHMILAANENHWNGRPFLDSIRYDYYANISLAACAFIQKSATFIGVKLSGDDLSTINYPCNRKLLDLDDPVSHVFISQNPGLITLYMGLNTNVAPLNDEPLRLAIAKTIDREGYATGIKPYSEIADSFISPYNTFWFNTTLPKYRVPRDIVDNRVTKIFDAINMELETANYMDWNYDGWRETPLKTPISLTLLRIESETPALVDTLVDDIKSVGLNIADRPVSGYPEIASELQANNFTLFLNLIETQQTPSFLFDYFHSSGANNYFDYANPTMDALLEGMRDSLNTATRQDYVRHAQSWIATSIPAAPILHFKALYIYDKDDYEGWVNQLGGINNFWSFYYLHSIPRGAMTVEVTALTQVSNRLNAGDSTDILVAIENDTGPIDIANIEVTVSLGSLTNQTGTTDSFGWFTATYTAPAVDKITEVIITAKASKSGHNDAEGQTAIAVHPASNTMSVSIAFDPNKRNLASNEKVTMMISVSDGLNPSLRVVGANVTIIISPTDAGGQLTTASGTTDSNGRFDTEFSADVAVDTNFALQVSIKKNGYVDYTTSVGIIVTKHGGVPNTPGPDVIILVSLVTMLAFIYGVTRRRKRDS